MNAQTDQQLLRAYAAHRSEAAFAELARRHVDFVYSAALRMVCDAHLAQDVTQAVFVALAQNANQLTDHPVLSGWLHRTAQNLASKTVRTDVRRRAREQEAVAMNELLSTGPDVSWEQIAPHLDAALGELSEPDRDALLLRYFEKKSAAEMAERLGVSAEAAQKRVTRAVERLRELFTKRGVAVGASGLAVVITANAVHAAPMGLALTISTASALTGTTLVTTASVTATKAIAMTAIQKTLVTATLVLVAGIGIYEARQISVQQGEIEILRRQQSPLTEQIGQLNLALTAATNQLTALRDDNARLNHNTDNLLKLRGEVGRLRNDSQELAQLKAGNTNDSTILEAVLWKSRVTSLKQHLEQNPGAGIPELQFASNQDWLDAARRELKTDEDYRRAMSGLRNTVQNRFANDLQEALKKYLDANNKQFPTDLSQLQPYFKTPVDEAILQRYAILPKDQIPNLRMGGDWIISQKSPVDADFDSRVGIGPSGWGSSGPQSWNDPIDSTLKTLDPVMKAYAAANSGQEPSQPSELLPFITTPEQKTAYEKALKFLEANERD